MNHSNITGLMRGFTVLVCLNFSVELESGKCHLILDLAESEIIGAKSIRAEFSGVSNLCLKNLGGGINQLLCLAIEDIRDRQLDRISYQVQELEEDSLSFYCQSLSISALNSE